MTFIEVELLREEGKEGRTILHLTLLFSCSLLLPTHDAILVRAVCMAAQTSTTRRVAPPLVSPAQTVQV